MMKIRQKAFVLVSNPRNTRRIVIGIVLLGLLASLGAPIAVFADPIGDGGSGG